MLIEIVNRVTNSLNNRTFKSSFKVRKDISPKAGRPQSGHASI